MSMREVGVFELSISMSDVEQGEEILVTKGPSPVGMRQDRE